MATRANGELVGVHVRSADGAARPKAESLDQQRQLLEELGGRYAEITAIDVASALVAFARSENATQLVLGASGRSRVSELFGGSVINRAVREAHDLDVHVISTDSEEALPSPPRPHRLAAFPPRRRQVAWVLATVGIGLLLLSLSPIRSSVGLPGALLVALLGVVIVTVVGGVPPSALAVVVAALLSDFFFTRPYHSLRISHIGDFVALVVFVAVAALVSVLVDRLTRRGLQMSRAVAEAEALARLAGGTVLSKGEPLPDLVAELRRTFGLDAVAVLAPVDGDWRAIAAAGGPVPARPELASYSAELSEGTVLVLTGSMSSADDRRLLSSFVTQLRLAQERAALETQAASAAELQEANTLRNALLAAVSHDLRTPLASIKAAATSLLSDDVAWNADEERGFARTIDDEADRLTHLVTNLLDMSRLQTGALRVVRRSVGLEDVLYSTVATLGSGGSRVIVDVDQPSLLLEVDPGLLERALANIIDNALKWSPDGGVVRVEAGTAGDHVDVRVIDQGLGIPPDQRDTAFQAFQQLGDGAGDRPTGVGLGLAVARGFVDAIGGSVMIEDTPGGGTTVVCSLPRSRR